MLRVLQILIFIVHFQACNIVTEALNDESSKKNQSATIVPEVDMLFFGYVYAAGPNLPACNKYYDKKIYYIPSTGEFQYCLNKKWTPIDLKGKDGKDGTGLKDASVNQQGELLLELEDDRRINAGVIKGEKGEKGEVGAKGDKGDPGDVGGAGSAGKSISSATVNSSGELILTMSDTSTINAGVVKGEKGDNGATGAKGEKGEPGEVSPSSLKPLHEYVRVTDTEYLTAYSDSEKDSACESEFGSPFVAARVIEYTIYVKGTSGNSDNHGYTFAGIDTVFVFRSRYGYGSLGGHSYALAQTPGMTSRIMCIDSSAPYRVTEGSYDNSGFDASCVSEFGADYSPITESDFYFLVGLDVPWSGGGREGANGDYFTSGIGRARVSGEMLCEVTTGKTAIYNGPDDFYSYHMCGVAPSSSVYPVVCKKVL